MRDFSDIAKMLGRWLAIICAQTSEQADRIAFSLEFKNEIEQKRGHKVVDALVAIGLDYDASVGAKVRTADCVAVR